jgi:threonine dehydratase
MMITQADVEAAAARLAGRLRVTPLFAPDPRDLAPTSPGAGPSGAAAPGAGSAGAVLLKLEQLQHTGSFKVRGAFNRILAAREGGALPAAGVVTASGGNAGLAVAYAARELEVPACVYLPATAPPIKIGRLRALGAAVRLVDGRYADAHEAARRHAADEGALLCHAYDQPEICAGQGTLALELFEQARGGIDTIVLAVGGGGLLAGVATAAAGRARVVAVEPETIPTLHDALAAGAPVDVEVSGVAVDALGATRVGDIAFAVATGGDIGAGARAEVRSVLVTDDDLVAARRMLWERYRLVVEHGSAAAPAALLSGAYRPGAGERVAVVCCGGNTDPADL